MTGSTRRVAAVLLCVFLPAPALAATIVVDPPPASIQAAVDAANPGDVVQLAAGTYVQEVKVVSKSLTIQGAGRDLTIIRAPDATIRLNQSFVFGSTWWTILLVDNQAAPATQTVTIADLTVDGSNQQDTLIPPIYGSSDRFVGIGFHQAGGTVRNVRVTSMRQSANFNELAGTGIVNASSTVAVSFDVEDSLVDFYQRGGIDFRGATLTANVSGTTVDRGYVLTPNTSTATPNGIQYSLGAGGSVTGSAVNRNVSTVADVVATGVILFSAGSVSVAGNTFDGNDVGLYALQAPDPLVVDGNTVTFTQAPGVNAPYGIIVVDPVGTTTLSANRIENVPGVAMHLSSTADRPFALSGNRFVGGTRGLELMGAGATGPMVSMSGDRFDGTSGDYIALDATPHDLWPSTASVRFDGRISGGMSLAQFDQVNAKIVDQRDDPALGLVLEFIEPPPLPPPTQVPVGGPAALAATALALALAARKRLRRAAR